MVGESPYSIQWITSLLEDQVIFISMHYNRVETNQVETNQVETSRLKVPGVILRGAKPVKKILI